MGNSVRNVAAVKNKQEEIAAVLTYASHHEIDGVPSPMVDLGREFVFEAQLRVLGKHFGPTMKTIGVFGLNAQECMKKFPAGAIKIENEGFKDYGAARSIGIGLHTTSSGEIVVVDGAALFNREALCFDRSDSCIVLDKNGNGDIGSNFQGDVLELLMYGIPDNKFAGICFFKGKELSLLKKICWDPNKYKFGLFEIINEIIRMGGNFKVWRHNNMVTRFVK